ncbi:ATPase component of ABC transporters with duplicated ATPase domain [Desulfitobacterium dichloroeliminans LMG P-21439]|uniref:ATPase component of ABC transporters with duplicated ATPase domain n=1 Tax=Desulfitobacterium dichloroeliminans (strain LMG P-21439 / DCA1) TaxID=871963 RepID=L0F5C4_DESDL|nr:ATPase component of ABC transporters with duplicated ATPase domain [Desulfitobacterium dichloroeliminans LMG P-21439]
MKKYFGDRLVIDIKKLSLYSEDRIGIVGINGAGKTTLLNLLSQKLQPDEGWVKLYGQSSTISQLESPEQETINQEMASKFKIPMTYSEKLSGGEKTRFKLAVCLSQNSTMIFADEPTSNMDMEGIEQIEHYFAGYDGGLFLISHDRGLLDGLCNKILELEDGQIKIYPGNYRSYCEQKARERERAQFEYGQYVSEKKRLERVVIETSEKSKSIRKTPRRMGNSEARLHKMGNQKAKANLDRSKKSVETRIEQLEIKEKPNKIEKIKLDLADTQRLHSKVIIEGKKINKAFSSRVIFKEAGFQIENGAKVALIGPNGCGKSTLLKMIMKGEESIRIAPSARIGYFSQDLSVLEDQESIMDNVMAESIYPESFVRSLLARLLFKGDQVYKRVKVLSGGERVKASFAKILCQDYNLLVLDEPTNYLDINSLEVIEEALQNYDRSLLFVSHDRRFIRSVANSILNIEDHKLISFKGNYTEYLASRQKVTDSGKEEVAKKIFVLQNRLSEVVGRISLPSKKDNREALDQEYDEILAELKRLRAMLK